MDRILIEDLLIRCIIGVNDSERRDLQDVVVNVALEMDLHNAGISDRLGDTIDYRSLKKEIFRDISESSFHLIEALAERVAEICLMRPLVRRAFVKVEKPSALRFARSVAVEIQRERTRSLARAFISIGSNINPQENVREAMHLLAKKTQIVGISTFYRNEAIGGIHLPPFINGIVEISTGLSVESLKFDLLRGLEAQLGRERTADKYAPRTIDLDLIFFDEAQTEYVTLLDQNITRWAYLAVPLAELAPDLVLPGEEISIARIAAALTDQQLEPLPEFSVLLKTEILHG